MKQGLSTLHPLITLILIFSGLSLTAQPGQQGAQCYPVGQGIDAGQIDSIFTDWNGTDRPGGAFVIVKEGVPLCMKAYGLASLEYSVPNTTETIFNVASVSKQFTAFGILLLAERNKLSLDDDIRQHLTNLPDFGEVITIRHMLQHTSGLRSLHALFQMAGWRGDDRRSGDDLMRYMEKQKDLNFPVGSEYLYCNTGFIFAAEIIEKVTGQEFNDWMTENVFTPLGMDQTFFREDYNVVVPKVATSYYGSGRGPYRKSVEYWAYHGSGNLHTTVGDLVQWLNNFHDMKLGTSALHEQFLTNATLTSGERIDYALGINVNTYKGVRRYAHGGSIGGYRSHVVYFPDHQLGIAVLGNFSASNPGARAYAMADILLGDVLEDEDPAMTTAPPLQTRVPSAQEMERLAGHYKWTEGARYREIAIQGDSLVYRNAGQQYTLGVLSKGKYLFLNVPTEIVLEETTDASGTPVLAVSENGVHDGYLTKYVLWSMTAAERAAISGQYYGPEVETTYEVRAAGESLTIYHPRRGQLALDTRERDHLYSGNLSIRVKRSGDGTIEGLRISNGRVRNMWFERVR